MDNNEVNNNNEKVIGQVQVATEGTIKGKKIVVPKLINYNKITDRLNIHLNDKDIMSLPIEDLGVNLVHSPGGKPYVDKPVELNSTIAMRVTGETENARFVRPTSHNFDLVRNTLNVRLDKEHQVEVSNERMKSMGLAFEFVRKQRSMER
ncbi:MAG: hypothetical protein KDD45_00595 [Bdellovibrionales bacterium]|nr:hypothetical protein [Bdellovibrionales bacterium]